MKELSNGVNIERMGASMILRFTRPEIRNPLSVAVVDSLINILSSPHSKLDAIVFTGSDGVFASGANLREIEGVSGSTAGDFANRGQGLMNLIANVNAKTIAAVNGYCYGGALDLALACDYRIASPNAEFCHPGSGLGIMTGWGGTQRLPRLVGEASALEMFLTGKKVSANEALHIRLIDEIADDPVSAATEAYL